MGAVAAILDYLLIACGCIAGLLAASTFSSLQRLGSAARPPLEYGPDTLRDFELLLAAESALLFGFFVHMTAGYYELAALQTASRVPAIIFTVITAILLFRWRRRVA